MQFKKGNEDDTRFIYNTSFSKLTKTYENVAVNTALIINWICLTSGAKCVYENVKIKKQEPYIQIPTTIKRGLPRDLETIGKKISTTLFGFHIDHTWYTGESE